MRSFARLVLVLALTTPAAAQVPAVEQRVRDELAARWSTPAGTLHIEWGRWPADPVAAQVPFRLQGDGRDGRFLLVLRPDSAARAVPLRAGVPDSAWVASRPLGRGTILTDADIRAEEIVRWGPPAPSGAAPVGLEVQRAMGPGQALTAPAVAPRSVIAAGDPVRLTWRQGSVVLEVVGTAVNSARVGERVRVRLDGRPGRLTGIASGPGAAILGGEES